MKTPVATGRTVLAFVVIGVASTACGSDATTASSSSSGSTSATTTQQSTPSATAPGGVNRTMADYVRDAGISQTPVKRGDPGSPAIDLPLPAGWQDTGARTPDWAYSAIVLADPAVAADPPTVIAIVTKLTGPVDGAKLLEYAPGELKNLPGFDGMGGTGKPTKFAGFDAFQFGGSYVKDGVARVIAQKTVIIPAKNGDGVYVLQMNANGVEDQIGALMTATAEIDAKTTITP